MLAVAFIRWWYGPGWKQLADNTRTRLHRTMLSFSVPTLARTLFLPWKRIVTAPGSGIDAYIRAAIDNTVSRLVGFTVRIIVLATALLMMGVMTLVGALQIIVWPVLPVLMVVLLVKGMP